MAKQNNLWRLDLLEVEYLKTQPRYSRTRLLLKSKNRAALLPKSRTQALDEIEALKQDIFGKKLHSSLVKYNRSLKKIIKTPAKNIKEDELKFIKSLDVEKIVNIKIIKIVQNIFKLIPKKLQNEPDSKPKYIPEWILNAIVDKESKFNQSNFYNSLSQDEKNYYSKLMNHKEIVNIVKVIENSFKIVLGPVKTDEKKDIEDVSTSESESEDEAVENDSDDESEESEAAEEEVVGSDEDDYSKYDALVAGSEDEDDEVELDNTVNYNEVTDTEPSDNEDDVQSESEESEDELFEKPKDIKKEKKEKKEKKLKEHNLPELATGYFSGGSDSEIEDDEVVQKITKPQKKNRRGQRARQKIWEAKFKNQANHIKKEKEAKQKQYEQRQKEYEARVAKREARAKEWEKTGANSAPLKQRTFKKDVSMPSAPSSTSSATKAPEQPKETKLHPSWEAKKKQEAALKNVKFQGKKITF